MSVINDLEALRDTYRQMSSDANDTCARSEISQTKALYNGKADAYSSAAAGLSRLITTLKAHPPTYKLVVCIDHGSFDGIYTTAPEGTLQAFVHTYDLDNLPTPQAREAHPIYVDDETIAPYLKPHGLKVSTLKSDMDMPDNEVLVAIPGEDGKMVYYPIVMARNVRQSGYTVLEPIYPLQPVDQPEPGSI